MKICNECKKSKPFSDFYKRAKSSDGLQFKCKVCSRVVGDLNYRKNHAHYRAYDKNNKLVKKFGITQVQFDEMVRIQDGKCAICFVGTPGGRGTWSVDHNHKTGLVRALLCFNCNVTLGRYENGWNVVISAFEDYLKIHS